MGDVVRGLVLAVLDLVATMLGRFGGCEGGGCSECQEGQGGEVHGFSVDRLLVPVRLDIECNLNLPALRKARDIAGGRHAVVAFIYRFLTLSHVKWMIVDCATLGTWHSHSATDPDVGSTDHQPRPS